MRAPPLDLRLLEVFEAIFVDKSLTNAALKLDMTQPAVRQSPTRMRTHFGDTLFVRAPDGMEPTPRAKELFASVAVILREARESLVARPVLDPATSNRERVVATTDLGAAALIPGLEELALPIELPAYPITRYWHARYHNNPGLVWPGRLVFELFSTGSEAPAWVAPAERLFAE